MNIVDSCGWLAYIADEANADFFAPVLQNEEHLLLPPIITFEVTRRLHAQQRQPAIAVLLDVMQRLKPAHLTIAQMAEAAASSQRYKLHMADAIIWQTAQAHGATLYTQDAALKDLPNVKFQAKPN
jgi:toxin FitB